MTSIAEEERFELLQELTASKKYRAVAESTLKHVLDLEASRHSCASAFRRGVREKLHRIAALYLGEPNYKAVSSDLVQAFGSEADAEIRAVCLQVLESHASTRERLPELGKRYAALFEVTGIPASILDLACAFNPFAWRWMGLPRSVRYHACDINTRIVDLVGLYLRLEGVSATVELRDILVQMPDTRADVALLLKMYHCLEARLRGAGWEVARKSPARFVVVSLPTKSLAGRERGIAKKYGSEVLARSENEGWSCREVRLEDEVFFIVDKG